MSNMKPCTRTMYVIQRRREIMRELDELADHLYTVHSDSDMRAWEYWQGLEKDYNNDKNRA